MTRADWIVVWRGVRDVALLFLLAAVVTWTIVEIQAWWASLPRRPR